MHRFRNLIPALVIVTLGAVGILARPGSTASARPDAALPLGYVDMSEVADKSVVGQNTRKEAEALKAKFQDALEKKQKLAYLNANERKELETLLAKTSASDAEKARIAELQGASEKMEKELIDLSQKTSPSEAERKRIQELTQRQQAAAEQFGNDRDSAQQELNEKAETLVRALNDRITKAVEEVARNRGLAMIVHKEARLFGGTDITEDVIGRLKK
jgi:Skp family chaperone for outer membrane proteins